MDFNKIMQDIMTFINDNTLLLIGICVFLILVLIGYLIDNSVKSKRIRNDIKNKDQVPKNIKEEIIKEAEAKGEIVKSKETKEEAVDIKENKEDITKTEISQTKVNSQTTNVNVETQNNVQDTTLNLDESENTQETTFNLDIQNDTLDNSLNLDSSLKVEDAKLDNLIGDNTSFDTNINLDTNVNLTDKQADTLKFNLDSGIISNNVPTIDPDASIMSSVINPISEYTNDKKLSEILSENSSLSMSREVNNSNKTPLNIEINTNTNNASQDELEQIMQKLSSLKNDTEEDNYTNIF